MIAATGWQALYACPTPALAGPGWSAWDVTDHVRLDVVLWEEVTVTESAPVIAGWVIRPHELGLLGAYLAPAPDVTCLSSSGFDLDFVKYIRVTDEVTHEYVESAP